MSDLSNSEILDLSWNSINELWCGFDVEQVIGSMPDKVFQKAQELSCSREMHDYFFTKLLNVLTDEEKSKLISRMKSEWNLKDGNK